MIGPEQLKKLLGIGGMSRPDTAQPAPQMAAVLPPPAQAPPPPPDPRVAQMAALNDEVGRDSRPQAPSDILGKVLFAIQRTGMGMSNPKGYAGLKADEAKAENDRQDSLLNRVKTLQAGYQGDRGLDIQEQGQNRLLAQSQAQQAYQQQQEGRLTKAEEDRNSIERDRLAEEIRNHDLINTKPTGSTDPYGERKVQHDGKVFIQTYSKSDPEGKTLSERPEGPIPATGENAANSRSQRSYEFESKRLDDLAKPLVTQQERLERIKTSISQNDPTAQALMAPEILTAMAGGQGSGLRMTEAEISRIIGGRSHWEDLKAWAQRWQLDPKTAGTLTPNQIQSMSKLAATMSERIAGHLGTIQEGYQGLIDSDDPAKQRKITTDVRQRLMIGMGDGEKPPPPAPTVTAKPYPEGTVIKDKLERK